MTTLKCLCGAVELEITAPPIAQYFCHCDDCQSFHGAAYVGESMYPANAVNVTRGSPTTFTLKSTPRTMCPRCGARLFAEVSQINVRCVTATLLPTGSFAPTFHMQCKFAARTIKDELPHWKGMPAAFGGADEPVGW